MSSVGTDGLTYYNLTSTQLVSTDVSNSTNYYGSKNIGCFTCNTTINTFTNRGVILGGGGGLPLINGSDGFLNNGTISIFNNLGAFLGGGGGGGGNTLNSTGGAGGGGGGGGGQTGTNSIGGSLLNNPSACGGGGPRQNGATFSTYIGGTGGGYIGGDGLRNSNGINSSTNGLFTFGGGGGAHYHAPGYGSGGGGYGSGNANGANSIGGGGGGGGISVANANPGGKGGYSIYNTGVITTLTNMQGGINYLYGPCFYAGNAPTNYNIYIQSASRYGQLYCIGWATTTGYINFGIDPTSTISSKLLLQYVLIGVTPTNLRGRFNSSWVWQLIFIPASLSIYKKYYYNLIIDTNYTEYKYITNAAIIANPFNSNYRHVAFTISGSIHTLYLDGVAISTNEVNILHYYSTISKLYIGSTADLSYGFTGIIDDFKIWNRALPASDISAIFINADFINPL